MRTVVAAFLAAQLAALPVTQLATQSGPSRPPKEQPQEPAALTPSLHSLDTLTTIAPHSLMSGARRDSIMALLLEPGQVRHGHGSDTLPVLEPGPAPMRKDVKAGLIVLGVLIVAAVAIGGALFVERLGGT